MQGWTDKHFIKSTHKIFSLVFKAIYEPKTLKAYEPVSISLLNARKHEYIYILDNKNAIDKSRSVRRTLKA